MDEIEKLYGVLKDKGYYTKSIDDFRNQWNDANYQSKVYDVVSRDGLYTKDKESFLTKYASQKKKDDSDVISENQNLVSKETTKNGLSGTSQDDRGQLVKDIDTGKYDARIDELQAENQSLEAEQKTKEANYSAPKEMFRSFQKGSARLGEMLGAIPEFLYDIFAIPQNVISDKFDIESLSASSEKFKDIHGIENVVKDYYSGQVDRITKEQEEKDKPIFGDITTNIKQGNISDAFRLIGNSVSESLPATLGIAMSGGSASAPQILGGVTTVFGAGENEAYKKEKPDMNNNERVVKALGKGFAEGVFSSIGSAKIGVAAKEIILKEGKEEGAKILKVELVNMYKELLKKYSIPTAMVGEGLEEAATQMTQNAIDGKPIMEGVSDSFIIGAASGGGFGITLEGVKKISNTKTSPNDINNVEATLDKEESIKNELSLQVKEGDLTSKEAKEIYDNWTEIKSNLQAVPGDFSPEQKAKAVDLIKEKKSIEKEIQGKDPVLVEDKKAKIEEINTELKSIKNPDAKTQETTQETEKQQVETPTSETEAKSKGKTIKVYHGTPKQFNSFDFTDKNSESPLFGVGLYTTTLKDLATFYSKKGNSNNGKVIEMEISVNNPISSKSQEYIDLENKYTNKKELSDELKNRGYDAIEVDLGEFKNYVIFDQSQILKDNLNINETTPTEDTQPNGEIQPNIEPSEQQGQDNNVSESVDIGTSETTPKINANNKYTEAINKIKTFFSSPKDTRKPNLSEKIGVVTNNIAQKIQDLTGIDVSGYNHSIAQSQINHALKEHGDPKKEADRGQIAITEQDFERIPEILDNPDSVKYVGKNKIRRDVIEYTKAYNDGNTIVFEAILGKKKKELEFSSMFKRKNRDEQMQNTPSRTSETLLNSDTNLQKDKENNKNDVSNQQETKSNTQKAKDLADTIRKAKVNRPDIFSSATPASIVWDGAIETVATAIETGGKLADAIQKGVEHIKKSDWYQKLSDNDKKRAIDTFTENVSKTEKPKTSTTNESFRDTIKAIPQSGIFKEYLSGETIKREHSEPRNEQDYEVVVLEEVAQHGKNTIEKAKDVYGKKYVEETLKFLDESNLDAHEKALVYVALENEMYNRTNENTNNVGEQKLQDLVRKKSQEHLRKSSLAINAGRLRAMMKDGYISDGITNKMYSEKQKENKGKIQKAIESDIDAINNEAESLENEPDFDIKKPKIKRTKKVVKNEIKQLLKEMRENNLKSLRGDTLNVSIPYAKQIVEATPYIIKISKLLAELGGITTREIINEIHNNIKDTYDKITKQDIRDVLEKANKPQKRRNIDPKVKHARQLVKEALIEKGFSRDINVRVNKKDKFGNIVKDENGRNIKVKERRTVLDWKKLAGEAGSIDNIRENVESVMKDKGYSEKDIENMSKELENEYNELRAGIIEKSLRELERRNEIKKKIDIKSSAKRLAELFNYGMFEKEADTYNNLINSALGFNDLDHRAFKKLQELAKTLADLYNQDVSEIGLQTSLSYINKEIARTLNDAAFAQGNNAYKLASIVQEYINLSTRFLLHSLGQIIENPFSGYAQRLYSKLGYSFDKTDNKELSKQRRKISKERFKSIVRDGGNAYGDTSSLLINDSKVENWLNRKTNNEIQHSIISFYMGRAFLEGFDSRHKTVLTEKYFAHNLIKILTSPTNPNRMSKEDALNFVTERLTGQSFEDAKNKARAITETINKKAGRNVLSEKERAINIFAQDIMKDTLLEGNVLTNEQLEASYNAAYKSAGKDIGHVANNPASEMVGALNNSVERKLQNAIKEKDWNKAAYLKLYQMFTRNILNTFVGGGTNWIVLGLEKSGLYGVPLLALNTLRKSNNKIDLTTNQGIKDLEKTLREDMEYKNMATRVVLGTGLAIIMGSLAVSTGADDDIDEWLKKNEWARKYFNKLAPEVLIAILATKEKDMSKYFKHVFNAKSEFFDLSNQAARSMNDLVSDKETKGSEAGKMLGGYTNFPAPTKTINDLKNIYDWANNKEITKPSYKASGFWNGFFMGGVVEKVGLRPGENPEMLEIKEIMDKRLKRPERPSRAEQKEKRDKKIDRERELKEKAKKHGIKYVPPKR